jgi:hypothetical protein
MVNRYFMSNSHFAPPKGFGLELPEVGVGSIFGDERGLGVTDALPDLGSSSNFLRANWGVGGVELFAEGIDQKNDPDRIAK